MYKIIIYHEDKEWLTINLSEPIKLAELLTAAPVIGGHYYVAAIENGVETERTPNGDEKAISRHIDALLDHLLETGQQEEADRFVEEIDDVTGHKKKKSWLFWACLGFLGFSALSVLYRTILSFYNASRINILFVAVNALLAVFLIWGVTFFALKKRNENS